MLRAPLMLLAGAAYAAPYAEVVPRTNVEATTAFECDGMESSRYRCYVFWIHDSYKQCPETGTPFTATYINQVIQHAATQKDAQAAMKQAAVDENYAYYAFKQLPDC